MLDYHNSNYHLFVKVLAYLDEYLRHVNPYCETYKSLMDFEKEEKAKTNGALIPDVSLCFKRDKKDDQRRFNAPIATQIAAVFTGENGLPEDNRDFVVFPHSDKPKLIKLNDLSKHIDPMSYPLLFFFGEPGWTTDLDHTEFNRLEK